MNIRMMRLAFNLFPPYWGTGIKVTELSNDFKRLKVQMPLRWYNRNLRGTHFGGSLFSMTDPFYMFMLIQVLGKDYDVWDQSSSIRFRKPGKGLVSARFELPQLLLDDIILKTASGEKATPEFIVDVTDERNEIVAQVTKSLYIRKR